MTVALVVLSVLLCGAVIYCILLLMRLREQQQKFSDLTLRNRELHSMTHSGELKALRYKLNPHLFKNALNSIQSHAYQTYYSMDKLSGVLDYILYDSDQPLVEIAEEMEFALNFIEINRLKLSPLFDLRIRNQIDTEILHENDRLKILPLVTVDLIENAFKHTDFQKNESFISISFQLVKDVFTLEVSNRISEREPLRKRNSGMGLKNLEERLSIAYPDQYQLQLKTEGTVFHASLQIRLHD